MALDQSEMMSGGCFALALRLHVRTGLPLFGLVDRDEVAHHAFVGEPDQSTYYDARGAVAPEVIGQYRGRPCAGTTIRPFTASEVEAVAVAMMVGNYLRPELDGYIRRVPGLRDLVRQPRLPESPNDIARPKRSMMPT